MRLTRTPADEQLTALLHYAEDAVLVLDENAVVRRANELAAELFGYDLGTLVDLPMERLLPERYRHAHGGHIARFVASGQQQLRMANRRPVPGLRADGVELPLTVAVSVITESYGTKAARYLVILRDGSEREDMERRIDWMSRHDALTGLATRRAVTTLLELHRHNAPDEPMAVLAIDIEGFGMINHTVGARGGDQVLVHVAERLAELAERFGGHAGRLGGDEFVLAIPGLGSGTAAEMVAFEIGVRLSQPVVVAGTDVRVRVAMGARIWTPDESDPELVLGDAIAAMAEARSTNRRSLVVFDETTRTAALVRSRLARDLREDIGTGALWLAYQPVTTTDSCRLVAAEALARWTHPELGPISPGHFIPIAEEDDALIDALFSFTTREACRQVAEWTAAGLLPAGFQLAVNVSARQLRSRNVIDLLRTALQDSRIDPTMLCLEVTETAAMEDLDMGADVLRSMRRLGVSIALDDFGTGYSSLSRLNSLPIDRIKLDGSLVERIVAEPRATAVVQAVLALAEVFGLSVVAECVETDEQRRVLESLGCPYVQGWLVAPAEPAGTFAGRHLDRTTPGPSRPRSAPFGEMATHSVTSSGSGAL